jgi:PIN domain nuclease of toxin-antitoxin system
MNNVVLDASAVLALINNEKGSEVVLATLSHSVICSVNLSEVVSKLTDRGLIETEIRADLDSFGFRVIDFDRELAYRSGLLRDQTKALGLSFGDRACLAVGEWLGYEILTSDRAWSKLNFSVPITIIR